MRQIINQIDDLKKFVNLSDLKGVELKNYAGILGKYELGKEEVHCQCVEEKKTICNQAHKHGYIVKISSGETTLIGNSCVKRFATSTQLRKDVNLNDNRIRVYNKLESLLKFNDNNEQYLEKLSGYQNEYIAICQKNNDFQSKLGNEINKLQSFIELPDITVQGIKHRKYSVVKKGKTVEKTEVTRTPLYIGSLNGLVSVLDVKKYGSFKFHSQQFQLGLDNLSKLIDNIEKNSYEPSEKEINSYRHQLESLEQIEKIISKLKYDAEIFFSTKPENLVFAYPKPYNLIMFFTNTSRQEAKKFCSIVEQNFKQVNKLDGISFGRF